MAVAWIGVVGAVVAAAISAVVALRQSQMAGKLALLQPELDAEGHRREAMIDRENDAQDVLARYSEPLAAAAFDLQSRLYNILEKKFFVLYGEGHPRAEDALRTTLFRIAQYFGWTEILRREIQYLSFPEADVTQAVAHLQSQISERFLTHEVGSQLMIWTDEQRAIGERMIVEDNGKVRCLGYGAFREQCDDICAPWYERLRAELKEEAARDRMRAVQRLLVDLVKKLDNRHVRYDRKYLKKAPLKMP